VNIVQFILVHLILIHAGAHTSVRQSTFHKTARH